MLTQLYAGFLPLLAKGDLPAEPLQALIDSGTDAVDRLLAALAEPLTALQSLPDWAGLAMSAQPWTSLFSGLVPGEQGKPVDNCVDVVCRRPPIIVGALASGLLSFGYLYAISIHNVPLAFAMSLLMWGVVYQGYNAVFPSFYPEMFPTRTRVSGMAISQNLGTLVTALLPAVFVAVAPPGATNIPMTIGAITLGITIVAALAAFTARETYRVHMNDLGNPGAVPVPKQEYDRIREKAVGGAGMASA